MAHFLTYPEAAVEVANHLIDHDAHGYSQPNREGVDFSNGSTNITSSARWRVYAR